jgi:hypothetical protein
VKQIISKLAAAGVLTLMAATFTNNGLQARTVNVRGTVVSQGSNEPLSGVSICNATTGHLVGSTNMDGQFTVSVDDSAELKFVLMGSESVVKAVNGQLTMTVAMLPKAHELEEIEVVAKSKAKVLVIEPTELDLKGNYIYLKKYVKVPNRLMDSSMRMIIQPSIYNVTRRTLTYLKPAVLDGSRYAITQERMYDWKSELDTLTPYRTVRQRSDNNVVLMQDSLYVQNTRDDFMCVVVSSLENYNRVIYADTFVIARGTVNPLRFLRYSLPGYEMTDERYLPQPEVSLRDTRGDMNLLFAVGKSKLDLSMGNNASEIQAMLNEFNAIETDPDMTLKSFSISGVASPEGRYETNSRLADERMKSAMDVILQSVPENLRRNAKVTTTATVAPWSDVEALLRHDGYTTEADAVAKAIAKTSNPDAQGAAIRRLSCYKTLIAPTYLPRMRKVSYEIVTSKYRPLNDEEITELYRADSSQLSAYHYHRLYHAATTDADKETIMRRALEVHPTFLAAATDLSALLINRGEADDAVLQPWFTDVKQWSNLPEETRYDYAVGCMNATLYSRADSLMTDLPDNDLYHKGKIYCAALNGQYADVVAEISQDSPLNEVLLLLALKDNETAWTRAQLLGDSAEEEYVKAIAANRMDIYVDAITHLENAFRLDPSLRDVARVDGDIVDLLEDVDDDNEQPTDGNE